MSSSVTGLGNRRNLWAGENRPHAMIPSWSIAKLSDRVIELGLQGLRPLSTDEVGVLGELGEVSPSHAAVQLWFELNAVIAEAVRGDLARGGAKPGLLNWLRPFAKRLSARR